MPWLRRIVSFFGLLARFLTGSKTDTTETFPYKFRTFEVTELPEQAAICTICKILHVQYSISHQPLGSTKRYTRETCRKTNCRKGAAESITKELDQIAKTRDGQRDREVE